MRKRMGVTCTACIAAMAAATALGIGGFGTLTGKTASSVLACGKSTTTTQVAAKDGATCNKAAAAQCSKSGAQKVAAKGECSCRSTFEAMDARLVKAKAAYKTAENGQCEKTQSCAKGELLAAKLAVAERDYAMAKAGYTKAKLASTEYAYETACASGCDKTEAAAKAKLLKAKLSAEETFTKLAKVVDCDACYSKHAAKMNEAKVTLAKFEYDAACAGTCEKTKAAAKAKLEQVKAECAEACNKAQKVSAKGAAAGCCATGAKKVSAKGATCNKTAAATCNKSGTQKVAAKGATCNKAAAATCNKSGAQKVAGKDLPCTWKQNNDAIDNAVVTTKAAYESACEGTCEKTKGAAKVALLKAKARAYERDYLVAKAKLAGTNAKLAENCYTTACASTCEESKSTAQAKLLKAKVCAEKCALAAAEFVDCPKCKASHAVTLNEAQVKLAKFEYDAACASGCEKSKAAAQAKLEKIKTQAAKGEPVALR